MPAKPSCAVQVGEHQRGHKTWPEDSRNVRDVIRGYHAVEAGKRKAAEEAVPQRLGLQQDKPFGEAHARSRWRR